MSIPDPVPPNDPPGHSSLAERLKTLQLREHLSTIEFRKKLVKIFGSHVALAILGEKDKIDDMSRLRDTKEPPQMP